jgi:capsular polysaccharide biosynthesis protein
MSAASPPSQPPIRLYLVGAAASAILAVVIALVVVLVATPVYRASTDVSIRPRIADLGAAEASARLIRNYAAWVDSEAYAARLPDTERVGLSDGEIVRNVRTNGDGDRLLVTIQSEDSNAARAASTVNGLATLLVADVATPGRLNDRVRGLEVSVIDAARPPGAPVWPRAEVALPIAAALGAVLGVGTIWLVWPLTRMSRG